MRFFDRQYRQVFVRVPLVLAFLGCAALSFGATGKDVAKPGLSIFPAKSADAKQVGEEGFKALRMRLVGVVNFSASNAPKALISMEGIEEDLLVGVGDLLGGYTLLRIGPDQIELEKGDDRQTLTIRNLRWVKANPKAKIVHLESPSPTSEPSKPTVLPRILAQAGLKKSYTVSKSPSASSSQSIRPNFVRPMTGWVSSPFGLRRAPRTTKGYGSTHHQGTDIAAPHGTTVYASAAGTVTASGHSPNKGYYVHIRHTGGYETCYFHLSKRYVKAGQVVKSRQRIGAEGSTGISRGAHLHFEIRRYGVALDASKFIPSLKYYKRR